MSQAFVKHLSTLDRGARARLRRTLQEDAHYPPREAMRYVEWSVAEEKPLSWRRWAHYLVAGLYALRYPDPDDSPVDGERFAVVAARVVRKRNQQELEASFGKETSLEKRFFYLLESEHHELAHPLRQWFALIKTANLEVDCTGLLKDIIFWSDRNKDTWARDFYRTLRPIPTPQAPDTNPTEESA